MKAHALPTPSRVFQVLLGWGREARALFCALHDEFLITRTRTREVLFLVEIGSPLTVHLLREVSSFFVQLWILAPVQLLQRKTSFFSWAFPAGHPETTSRRADEWSAKMTGSGSWDGAKTAYSSHLLLFLVFQTLVCLVCLPWHATKTWRIISARSVGHSCVLDVLDVRDVILSAICASPFAWISASSTCRPRATTSHSKIRSSLWRSLSRASLRFW